MCSTLFPLRPRASRLVSSLSSLELHCYDDELVASPGYCPVPAPGPRPAHHCPSCAASDTDWTPQGSKLVRKPCSPLRCYSPVVKHTKRNTKNKYKYLPTITPPFPLKIFSRLFGKKYLVFRLFTNVEFYLIIVELEILFKHPVAVVLVAVQLNSNDHN